MNHTPQWRLDMQLLIRALEVARAEIANPGNGLIARGHVDAVLRSAIMLGRQYTKSLECDIGLFGDHRQMDLQDRKDI